MRLYWQMEQLVKEKLDKWIYKQAIYESPNSSFNNSYIPFRFPSPSLGKYTQQRYLNSV